MTKSHGLGAGLYYAGYNVSGDTQQVGNIAGPNSPIRMTDITQSAESRLKGKIDGMMNITTYFDDADDAAHEAYSSLPRTDVMCTYVHRTANVGSRCASLVAKQVGYDATRGNDGTLTFAVNAMANGYGLEWGKMLTAGVRTDSSATSPSTGVDMIGGAGSFGLQAYLHVFSFTGTDATITIQESQAVDGSGDAFANVTGGAFTEVSTLLGGGDQGWERIQTARDQAVERYLRVVTTTSSGFSDLQFAVAVKVNRRETLFS